MNKSKFQSKLELITSKWWFYALFLIINFLPPYSTISVEPSQIGYVTGAVLSEGLIFSLTDLFSIFKIIPILLILSIVYFKNKASKIFSLYACINYVLIAVVQSIAFTNEYGFAIVTCNLIMFLLVAMFWFFELLIQKNDFTKPKLTPIKGFIIILALIAFYYPAAPTTYMPDFNPIRSLNNMAGLAFCLMTPLYIAVLAVFHPRINSVTLRVTSLTGIIIAFYNLLVNFLIAPEQLWWNGILHIPLAIVSVYGFIISFKK